MTQLSRIWLLRRWFMPSVYATSIPLIAVPKKKFFVFLPYFGYKSEKLKRKLIQFLSKLYGYIDFY